MRVITTNDTVFESVADILGFIKEANDNHLQVGVASLPQGDQEYPEISLIGDKDDVIEFLADRGYNLDDLEFQVLAA